MKNSIFLFFFLVLINITTFSNVSIPSKGIQIIKINGQYIDLNVSSYTGTNIILNQLSAKNKPIIKTNITNNNLEFYLNNDKKDSLLKFKTKFNLLVPQNTNFKYIIKTKNSSIFVDRINGYFYINNPKGKVTINNLIGDLYIFNSNKSIELSNIVGNIFIESFLTQVTTKNTIGVLNIQTTYKKIKIKNAEKIGTISTSNASIYAEFKNITPHAKVVTSNHDLTIKIPEDHNFNFSIFGDLVHVKNEFSESKVNNFLILGTSNGTINIEKN